MAIRYGERHDGDGLHARAIRHIQGIPKANFPGILVLDAVTDLAAKVPYYLWMDSTGALRKHTSLPTDQDSDGSVVISAGVVSANGLGVMGTARAKYVYATDGGGAPGLITPALNATIPDNAIIVGGVANSTTAFASGGTTNITIGTSAGSSASALLGTTAKASFSTDAILALVPTFAVPLKMTAAGSITLTTATTALNAGVCEITVFYILASA